MDVLIIGGTGLISRGIVKHLLARGANVSVFNRAQRDVALPGGVRTIVGDRNQFDAFGRAFRDTQFDVVIDMICFNAEQANSAVSTFAGRCKQFIFCSTVCTYGIKVPSGVFVDETFVQEPISAYGRNKLECERIFQAAQSAGYFNTTIVRPSHTYGEGSPMIDNLEGDAVAWGPGRTRAAGAVRGRRAGVVGLNPSR